MDSNQIHTDLEDSLAASHADLKLRVRSRLDGGRSSAEVHLVDFHHGGNRCVGVLKLARADKVSTEKNGHELLRKSWLRKYIPKLVDILSSAAFGAEREGLLFLLAGARRDSCVSLEHVITESFPYGKDEVLKSLAYVYREEGENNWGPSSPPPQVHARDWFRRAVNRALDEDWYTQWLACQLPDDDAAALVFGDSADRLPNPKAFLRKPDSWPESPTFSVPWITSHGDLNTRNMLCPDVHRAEGLKIRPKQFNPKSMSKHFGIIDTPHALEAPFCFDMAFLAACLGELLPPFTKRSAADAAVQTLKQVFQYIFKGTPLGALPRSGKDFADCVDVIWTQIRLTNQNMEEDLRDAFLVSIAASSLWLAIKARHDRAVAIRYLCMSSLSLKAAVPTLQSSIPGPDMPLRISESVQSRPWTEAARELGALFENVANATPIVLILGSEWGERLALPAMPQIIELNALGMDARANALDEIAGSLNEPRLPKLAAVPACAILDCNVFDVFQDAVATGMNRTQALKVISRSVSSKATEMVKWDPRRTIPYFRLAGTMSEEASIATTPDKLNQVRSHILPHLHWLRQNRAKDLVALCTGLTPSERLDLFPYLRSVWPDGLRIVLVSPEVDQAYEAIYTHWGVEHMGGDVSDVLAACDDFGDDHEGSGSELTEPYIRVCTIKRDELGFVDFTQLIDREDIRVSPEDLAYFESVGHLLYAQYRDSLAQVERDPREFLLGHRVLLSEIEQGIAIKRDTYPGHMDAILTKLSDFYPAIYSIPSDPGAGASTLLLQLAHGLAYEYGIPTLILHSGGASAFEAVEKLHTTVGRPFLVMADPEDLPGDELRWLKHRCTPSRYPVVFVTSVRLRRDTNQVSDAIRIGLSAEERLEFLNALYDHAPQVDITKVSKSPADSLFMLSLEAFGGARVKIDAFVSGQLQGVDGTTEFLLSTIAFFHRYAHRSCSGSFLQLAAGLSLDQVHECLAPFEQLLILREGDAWNCRHHELSLRILQVCLTRQFDDSYREKLAAFATNDLLAHVGIQSTGDQLVSEYFWSLINPRLMASAAAPEEKAKSLLLDPQIGIREASHHQAVLEAFAQQFPNHVLLVSHCGKFFSERGSWDKADYYLNDAFRLEPNNTAVVHMLGKRYVDETLVEIAKYRDPLDLNNPTYVNNVQTLAATAHQYFDRARELEPGSEYNYSTPIHLDVKLINWGFHRLGLAASNRERKTQIANELVAGHFNHAEAIVAEGLRYLEPKEESRRYFKAERIKLVRLRGELDAAIATLDRELRTCSRESRSMTCIQLSRYLSERAYREWKDRNSRNSDSLRDFRAAEGHMRMALDDGATLRNIRLWFDCARHLDSVNRSDFIQRIEELRRQDEFNLEANFLLMCLYFCEAVQTRSPTDWSAFEEYQRVSDKLSSKLAVAKVIREWLVETPAREGNELRFLPRPLFHDPRFEEVVRDGETIRVPKAIQDNGPRRLTGVVVECNSSTAAKLKIDQCGFELFFRPRIAGREFYQSDAEARTKVSFLVYFSYEKPVAFDVKKTPAG